MLQQQKKQHRHIIDIVDFHIKAKQITPVVISLSLMMF